MVKSYKRIRGEYADQLEMRKAVCCETGRSYAKEGGFWGQIWGHFERGGTDRGTKKTVHVRRCPLNVFS
jgi:hypothetical protein